MPEETEEIVHVSDTALMVAACRALETERADGLVYDPFAARLAGERGMAIAKALPMLPMMCFGVGIRSRFLDELVLYAIEAGQIETVLSLGAGLDTRPWRLDIPDKVRWIEVDLPAILQYKSAAMAGEEPHCKVEHVAADLNQPDQREDLFRNVGDAPALMITEGLLMYLPGSTVKAIATEAPRLSGLRYWLMDLQTEAFSRVVRMDAYQSIANMRPPDCLNGSEIFEVCMSAGWHTVQRRVYVSDVYPAAPERVKELAAFREKNAAETSAPPVQPLPDDDITGVHLFGYGPVADGVTTDSGPSS